MTLERAIRQYKIAMIGMMQVFAPWQPPISEVERRFELSARRARAIRYMEAQARAQKRKRLKNRLYGTLLGIIALSPLLWAVARGI